MSPVELLETSLLTLTIDDGVLVVEIDNPPINLITRELYRELRMVVEASSADGAVRAVVLRSANPEFFMAHFDVTLIQQFPASTGTEHETSTELNAFHVMCETLRTMAKPTICEIAGRVGGGGAEIAASCDMRFGAVGLAVLCQMEVPIGLIPGGSGTQRLPHLVGRGRAMEIVLGGDDIDTHTLVEWGWLNRAVPLPDLRVHVMALAKRIASFPPDVVAKAKESVLAASPDPTPGLLREAALFQETLSLGITQRRMQSFLDLGGQTLEGERRVGALAAEVSQKGSGLPLP